MIILPDLLKANNQLVNGVGVDPSLVNVRLRLVRAYAVFIVLWHIVLMPLALLFHAVLVHIDFHLLMILTILFTGLFFGTFGMFKEYMIDQVAHRQIRIAWKHHFPLFDYHLHFKEVSDLYNEAVKKDVPTKNLRLFVLDALASS
jgi:hypothetical protein